MSWYPFYYQIPLNIPEKNGRIPEKNGRIPEKKVNDPAKASVITSNPILFKDYINPYCGK